MVHELIRAARLLSRSPQFYFLVVALLGTGIAANTAIFGVYDLLLLRALPVQEPDRLVILNKRSPTGSPDDSFSYPIYRDLQNSLDQFDALVGFDSEAASIEAGGQSERGIRELVTGQYFEALGLRPHVGRLILPADDVNPGAHPVAVLTHTYWQSRFGSDAGVLGRTLRVNGYPLTIIGVGPPGFQGLRPGQLASVIVPMAMQGEVNPAFKAINRRSTSWMKIFGRLRPGITTSSAEAEASTVFQNLMRNDLQGAHLPNDVLNEILSERIAMSPGRRGYAPFAARTSRPLTVLFGGVGLLLVALCANVAGLLLARGETRAKEMAMRVALGASRFRLVRDLLTEGMILAFGGGALGLFLAAPLQRALFSYVVPGQAFALASPPTINFRMVLFAFGLSFCAVLTFSIAPAWRATWIDPMDGLRGIVSHRKRNWGVHSTLGRLVDARRSVVIGQVALATTLLVIAALFIKTTRNLRQQDFGFRGQNVTLLALEPSSQGYKGERATALYARILDRLNSAPGVHNASVALTDVLSGHARKSTLELPATYHKDLTKADGNVVVNPVSPGYFATMGITIKAGRDFGPSDGSATPLVAVVNDSFSRNFFESNGVGHRFRWSGSGPRRDVEIVGVVGDVKHQSARVEGLPLVYVPIAQDPISDATIHVRSRLHPHAVASLVRSVVRDTDPALALFDIRTLEQQLDRALMEERLIASSATAFGAASLFLAILGLYGIASHSVTRRTREFGIRLALGSPRSEILRIVLSRTLGLVGIGALVGIALANTASRLMMSLMFGVEPTDPISMAAVSALVCLTAVASVYVPARRASLTEPAVALRHE